MDGRYVLILIDQCTFISYAKGSMGIIKTDIAGIIENDVPTNLYVLIKNTSFLDIMISSLYPVIRAFRTNIYFEGPVIFSNIFTNYIIKARNSCSYLQFNCYIEMTNNMVVDTLMDTTEIYLEEETILNFTNNMVIFIT